MSGTAKKGIKARLISWAMKKMMAGAGGPPGSGGGGPPPWVKAMMAGGGNQSMAAMLATSSGFEGREKLLGDAVSMALRTLDDHTPYPHDMNDALVKMHLSSVQFAKDNGRIADYVAHDVKTMQPMLQRLKGMIEKTGEKEIALAGIFDRTTCLYQLCLDLKSEPGKRSFTFPYTKVLELSRKSGEFSLTDREVHELWMKPRLKGYAEVLGVTLDISDIGPDNKVTVALAA
ncbi:MAG: hypothetical protein FJ173_08040 [Gammaproteobacteria bacterium]|jgi:hypothetical protein|nr:hypothetical protein [Gammaproteobacteria bacterium]